MNFGINSIEDNKQMGEGPGVTVPGEDPTGKNTDNR